MNPAHMVVVVDFSLETLRQIADHIAASTRFEHFIYREAELDAIWSLTGFAIRSERDPVKRNQVELLRRVTHRAHDLIGEQKPGQALDALDSLLFPDDAKSDARRHQLPRAF